MDQAVEQSQDPQFLMENLLAAEDGTLEAEEQEEVSAQEETTEEVETEDEDSQEETESRVFKLKRGDEEIELPEEEVISLAQQGYDYTKKTQAVAEERKTVEERAQALKAQEEHFQQQIQLQQVLIKDIAKVEAINDQIAEYEKVDWQSFSDSDPVQAQKAFFQYQQLTNKRTQLTQELNAKHGQAQALRNQKLQQAIADGYKQLSKDIPDWSADKAQQIRTAAKDYGYSDQELEGIYDPRLVRLMHDAAQYRALQKARPTVENKVQNKPPVVKPGGKDVKNVTVSKHKEAISQLRKTGGKDLGAKLIEQML